MDYNRSRRERKKDVKGPSGKIWTIVAIAGIAFIVGVTFDTFVMDSLVFSSKYISRIKNTFLVTFFDREPIFYYVDIEKNGEEYRLDGQSTFTVSYRDEFVIKDVSTESIFERGITVDFEGVGEE
ncbi:MAG: hypothetical protein U9R24_05790, partial [Thermodesulfobacteriota bacterium]|nr:hypothetical protein [Thermodesulfobacteriota bacterium]